MRRKSTENSFSTGLCNGAHSGNSAVHSSLLKKSKPFHFIQIMHGRGNWKSTCGSVWLDHMKNDSTVLVSTN